MIISKAVKEIRSFNRFYTNIVGVVNRHILESAYSLTEVRILYEIYNGSGSTVRSLKHILRVDEGYLSRTITKLVKQGLITKAQSKEDGREYFLNLTKKGEKLFLELNKRSEESVQSMIEHLSSDEVRLLTASMQRIKEMLFVKEKSEEQ